MVGTYNLKNYAGSLIVGTAIVFGGNSLESRAQESDQKEIQTQKVEDIKEDASPKKEKIYYKYDETHRRLFDLNDKFAPRKFLSPKERAAAEYMGTTVYETLLKIFFR